MVPLETCTLQSKTDFLIDLDQDQYEEFLERIRGVEESETDEQDLEQEHGSRVRRASYGRNNFKVFRSVFYSKHGHKPQGTSVIPLGGVEKLLLQTSLQHQAE